LTLELADHFKQKTDIAFLAIELCDRFFMKKHDFSFTSENISLYSMTFLLIASKYDELDENIPLIKDLSRHLCRSLPSST